MACVSLAVLDMIHREEPLGKTQYRLGTAQSSAGRVTGGDRGQGVLVETEEWNQDFTTFIFLETVIETHLTYMSKSFQTTFIMGTECLLPLWVTPAHSSDPAVSCAVTPCFKLRQKNKPTHALLQKAQRGCHASKSKVLFWLYPPRRQRVR